MFVSMTMADAKKDFQRGLLRGFGIEKNMGVITLTLDVQAGGNRQVGELIDARTHSVRQFKTFDAAISALEQIGFEVSSLRSA